MWSHTHTKNILKWIPEENKQATKDRITQLENEYKIELDKLTKIILGEKKQNEDNI